MPVGSENGNTGRQVEDAPRPGQAARVGKWGSQRMVVRKEDCPDLDFFFKEINKGRRHFSSQAADPRLFCACDLALGTVPFLTSIWPFVNVAGLPSGSQAVSRMEHWVLWICWECSDSG